MTAVLNDRQRVELIFLPLALIDVLINGVDPTEPEYGRAKALLWRSVYLTLKSLDRKHRGKLLRRCKRAHDAVLSIYQGEGESVAKVGLMVFYIVQAAAECDYLILGPGSPFDEALTLIAAALQDACESEALNDQAKQDSRKALSALQGMGLFMGVEM